MDVRAAHREQSKAQVDKLRRHLQSHPSVAVICIDEIPLGMPIAELAVRLMPARAYLIIDFDRLSLSGWVFPGKDVRFAAEQARAAEGHRGVGELLARLNTFHAGLLRMSGHAHQLADFVFLTGLDRALESPGMVARELSGLSSVLPEPLRKAVIVLGRRELAASISLEGPGHGPR